MFLYPLLPLDCVLCNYNNLLLILLLERVKFVIK